MEDQDASFEEPDFNLYRDPFDDAYEAYDIDQIENASAYSQMNFQSENE